MGIKALVISIINILINISTKYQQLYQYQHQYTKMSLDFSLFHSPDQSQSFCNDLLDTLKKRGVARLTNHGIPDDVISQLFDMVYLPTSLPLLAHC